MRNLIYFVFLMGMLFACSESDSPVPDDNMQTKEEDIANGNASVDFSKQKLLLEGKFQNGDHSTSGNAKIYEDKDGKKTLVFENLKSDPGPDLRINLAGDKANSNFIEVSSKVENGNKFYELPKSIDLTKQKFVLIWCKKFAVLFGHAELK